MADNGELYKIFTPDFAKGMKGLCEKADIIVPNITEAVFLLGEPYREGPYTKEYIEHLLVSLGKLGTRKIVLTGVHFTERELGAATFDKTTGKIDYTLTDRIPGYYHGTGDVYASALLAGLLNGFSLSEAAGIAVRYTAGSIMRTYKAKTDVRFGVNFEQGFPELLKELRLL
jgi:pyridoxine kinase